MLFVKCCLLIYEVQLLELELELELELDLELELELESLEISTSTSTFMLFIISGWLSDIFFILYYYTIKKKYAIMCFLFKLNKICKVYNYK
jgi:hypothetical protein